MGIRSETLCVAEESDEKNEQFNAVQVIIKEQNLNSPKVSVHNIDSLYRILPDQRYQGLILAVHMLHPANPLGYFRWNFYNLLSFRLEKVILGCVVCSEDDI